MQWLGSWMNPRIPFVLHCGLQVFSALSPGHQNIPSILMLSRHVWVTLDNAAENCWLICSSSRGRISGGEAAPAPAACAMSQGGEFWQRMPLGVFHK